MIDEGQVPPESKKKETIFIGVAWPYANGNIHLGHVAGSLLSPDIFSRYHRMQGNKVLMVSGSDEHGTPITVRAEKEGKTPQEVVDHFHGQTVADLDKLKITFDLFTRTTHPTHYEVVQDLFLTLHDQGYIYPRTTTELYCTQCQKFLPDRYVGGTCPHCSHENARGDQCDQCGKTYNAIDLIDPACKICSSEPVARDTEHFFFKLSAFGDRLLAFLDDKNHWKTRVLNFTRNWILEGLKDRPITRDISWGVPVPLEGYDSKRIYVWFDAVTGYLSASKQWSESIGRPDAWKEFWNDPGTKGYYFLGKDNVPFHTIIWPAMLMGFGDGKGEDYSIPYDVPANEYLQLGGEKFTKSGGIGIEVSSFMKEFTSDEVRYYLSIVMPENRDVEFDLTEFKIHVNNELVATFGNFIHRVLSFTAANFGSFPESKGPHPKDDEALDEIRASGERIGTFIERCQFKNAMKEIMALASYGNRYLVERAPWKLVKTDREACGTVLNIGLRLVKALSIFTYPFLPESMHRLHGILGFSGPHPPSWGEAFNDFSREQSAMKLERPHPLFRQLELKIARTEAGDDNDRGKGGKGGPPPGSEQRQKKKQKKGSKKESSHEPVREIDIHDLDLRVGFVLEVQPHPNADKLYVLRVDVGEEQPRTLVAGLKQHYSPDELKGSSLIILCNLRPAQLRGITSNGMMLAASKGDIVVFLTPSSPMPPGTRVLGLPLDTKDFLEEITIQEFASLPLTVRKVVRTDKDSLVLDDDTEVGLVRASSDEFLGKYVVHASGKVLMINSDPVMPEKEVGPGAVIR